MIIRSLDVSLLLKQKVQSRFTWNKYHSQQGDTENQIPVPGQNRERLVPKGVHHIKQEPEIED